MTVGAEMGFEAEVVASGTRLAPVLYTTQSAADWASSSSSDLVFFFWIFFFRERTDFIPLRALAFAGTGTHGAHHHRPAAGTVHGAPCDCWLLRGGW